MYEYRVIDTEQPWLNLPFEGTEQECLDHMWYEWKYGLHAGEEGRFILQRRVINPRWEDVE